MVEFTNYTITIANITQSIYSKSPVEAGLFVYQKGDKLIVANSTTKNTIGVVLGESGVADNRIGGHHSVAIKSVGVLVQREYDVEFEAGDKIFVSDNGKATTEGAISVGTAEGNSKTIDGISVVVVRAVMRRAFENPENPENHRTLLKILKWLCPFWKQPLKSLSLKKK